MAEYLPIYQPGQAVTLKASAAVTGGRIVEVSGNGTVAHAAAGSVKTVGVAAFDSPADGNVTIFTGGVQSVTTGGAVTAGALVDAGATGFVVAGTTAPLGVALTTATSGAQVRVLFNR